MKKETWNPDFIPEFHFFLYLYLVFNVGPESFKGMLKGIIRGLGIQKYAVVLNLVGYWIICLPI